MSWLSLLFNIAAIGCIGGASFSLWQGEQMAFQAWLSTMLSVIVCKLWIESAELREELERRPTVHSLWYHSQ